MKKCKKCNTEKDLSEFNRNSRMKDGLQLYCRQCMIVYKRKHYSENKDSYVDYYIRTKDKRIKYQKDYWSKNPSVRSKIRNDYRVAKISSTIKSLTEDDHNQIKLIYEVARWLTIAFEESFHVDHIVPLQGENVCGLHVPWNLQILFARENISKSNKFEN